MKKWIDPFWVSVLAIVIGVIAMFASVDSGYRTGHAVVYAAVVHSAGIIVATGIVSLTLLKIFDKDKDK